MNQKPDTCKGCPLYYTGSGFAMGVGERYQKIWIIGEALGEKEAEKGEPFVGGSGSIMNEQLRQAGLYRGNCYITNAIRCRPPGNKLIGESYERGAKEHCRQYMDRDFLLNRPNIVLAFGNTALNYLTPIVAHDLVESKHLSIDSYRGSILWSERYKVKVLPTLHPANIMRQRKMWSIVVADLVRAREESTTAARSLPVENFNTEPGLSSIASFLDRLERDGRPVVIDIENSIHRVDQCALHIIGIGNEDESMSIPFTNDHFSLADEEGAWGLVAKFLEGPAPKVFHNNVHDITILESFGLTINNYAIDTMLLHHTLYAELRHKLSFVTSTHTCIPFYKDMRDDVEDEEDTNK